MGGWGWACFHKWALIDFILLVFWCFFILKIVAGEAEWSSDEAVDGLSGSDGDGVEVNWVFKDAVSVEVGGKGEGGETLPILNGGVRPQPEESSEPLQRCTERYCFWLLR